METALAIAGWSLFGLTLLVGLFLNMLGLFGSWLILIAVAAAWLLTGQAHFSLAAIIILAALAALGEILEAVAASFGATRFGGSKEAFLTVAVGCVLGGIAGTPWLPLIGTVIGACAGGFIAAALYEYLVKERHVNDSLWTGLGAALGKISGIFAKVMIAFIMLAVAAYTF